MVVVDKIIFVVWKDGPGFMMENRLKEGKNRLRKSS